MFAILSRFLAACGLILCALTAPAATILVYGDSLSAGYGLATGQDWASLLGKRLAEQHFNYKVANASISGETAVGGARRIETALQTHKPDIVIVALGANDGLRGGSLGTMKGSLDAIVSAAQRAGARPLIVGMQLPPNYGRDYAEKFRGTFGDIARDRKLPFVPFLLDGFADNPAYFQTDGLHPKAEAQPLILETVWKGLRPLLKK